MSALAGLVELAAVVEADEEARQLVENVVDLNALISEMCFANPPCMLCQTSNFRKPGAVMSVGTNPIPEMTAGCSFQGRASYIE